MPEQIGDNAQQFGIVRSINQSTFYERLRTLQLVFYDLYLLLGGSLLFAQASERLVKLFCVCCFSELE